MTSEDRWFAELTHLRRLELTSLVEAATLSVLAFVAMPLEHFGGWDLAVLVVAPIHGLAFTAFLWTVWQAGAARPWRNVELARLVVCACVPLGGFLNCPWLVRQTRSRVRVLAAEVPAHEN